MGSGTIADAIVERSGITGEKTEWMAISSLVLALLFQTNTEQINRLTIVFQQSLLIVVHEICMQIAAMNPIAIGQTTRRS